MRGVTVMKKTMKEFMQRVTRRSAPKRIKQDERASEGQSEPTRLTLGAR